MNEMTLVLLRQKNRKAQQQFYETYAVQMFRLSYRYVNNEQDAGSIVNIGFFRIFSNIEKFIYKDERGFIAWMRKIVINEALIFLRSRLRYIDSEDANKKIDVPQEIPENKLLLEDYYRLIRQLPDDLRTVFNLYAIDGYSHKEIADMLHISESSSRVYLMRARKKLQQFLKVN
jgi:RNA polymerase sigma factor (sigma-70 family)